MRRRPVLRLATVAMVAALFLVPSVAPGTVAEQRARLPPPAECGDDLVEGYWVSHQYIAADREWTEFTLEIHRKEGDENKLVGKILNQSWEGGAGREQAGKCGPKQAWRFRVSMTAVGTVTGDRIMFRGTSWKLDEMVCGTLDFGYLLDEFTGKIEPDINEFQSVNNDGGRMVNHPTVFRRVRCFAEGPPPSVKVEPPPIYPKSSSNCGCSMGVCR